MAIKISGTTVIDDSRNLTNLGSALTVAQGGTGLTAVGTANQVLAVNSGGTALEYQSPAEGLTAGKSIALSIVFGF
jgi:hypothetical protein